MSLQDQKHRSHLPMPNTGKKGLITFDAKDPASKFPPIERLRPPEGAPNVLVILIDDVGFGATSVFGGPCQTPAMEKLATGGLKLTRFHTTALCSPTRQAMLTGRNHHSVGMGGITEIATGAPGYCSVLPNSMSPLVRTLKLNGYSTAQFGKCHEVPVWETSPAGPFDAWPTGGGGFEYFYGFIGGEANQWYPTLYEGTTPVEPEKTPEEGYHLMEDMADKAIAWIGQQKSLAPDKPFFIYFAPGATHAPHHVPKEWADKYKGRFDMGYEAIREQTLARQKQLGLVPKDTELPPINPIGTPETRTGPDGKPFPMMDTTKPWGSLPAEEKALFSRMAEVYAGFLAHADDQIGRLLGFLEEFGYRENTLVVLVSDNGASGEGGPNGSVNEMKFANGVPDDLEQNLAMIDELGGTKTYNHYPTGWAMAFNTPFKMWKRYEFNGGTSDPCIIAWPAGIKARGEVRQQYHHAIDLVPTILDVLGVEAPETIKGHTQAPFDGVSMRNSFDDASAESGRRTQFYAMLGSRSIWHEGWKAVTTHPCIAGWGNFNDDEWELYHVDVDRSEVNNLAAEQPDKLREMINIWFSEAGRNGAFPLDDRTPVEILMEPRPQLSAPRNRYSYFPGNSPVPEWQAVNTKNRSFVIGAVVSIPKPGRRACCSRTATGSAATVSTSRTTACTTSTTSWAARSR
jgi:arylsulfatase A-like enzyme